MGAIEAVPIESKQEKRSKQEVPAGTWVNDSDDWIEEIPLHIRKETEIIPKP